MNPNLRPPIRPGDPGWGVDTRAADTREDSQEEWEVDFPAAGDVPAGVFPEAEDELPAAGAADIPATESPVLNLEATTVKTSA